MLAKGQSPGIEMMVIGRIDGNGTVTARQTGYNFGYNLTWQKHPGKRSDSEE